MLSAGRDLKVVIRQTRLGSGQQLELKKPGRVSIARPSPFLSIQDTLQSLRKGR
jgi:hypothetical protein